MLEMLEIECCLDETDEFASKTQFQPLDAIPSVPYRKGQCVRPKQMAEVHYAPW
jgi:hypothetical protein